jgi:WD40 repeat protein/tetratricopeptide (TPR) repeat protein/ActR/RegA family two-component response regulator
MSIEELIAALDRAGLDFHAEDVLDALWLAGLDRTLTLHSPAPAAAAPDAGPPGDRPPPPTPPQDEAAGAAVADRTETDSGQPRGEAEKQPAPVYAQGSPSGADRTVKASPVAVPAGRALADRLGLMRSLRPLRQRWPSRQALELDEEQTVETTAELRGARFQSIYPVFRAQHERWFDVDIVCEDDAAIELWDEALRDFSQMLRDTGAFRQVRSWRLRLHGAAASGASGAAVLETPTGGRVPSRTLAGRGVRRLVFFASHGASRNWRNGEYARVLEPWLHDCSIVLLHLMPYERWEHTRLGEPHGMCAAEQPGSSAAILKVEPFRWMISYDPRTSTLLPLPVTPLNAPAMREWAHMQMARGRRCPVFLIDPGASAGTPPVGDDLEPTSTRDVERSVAYLRETSPEAFRLAVNLCSAAFTVPVARLIQHTMFGEAADQSHLAELFLSGLIVARPADGDTGGMSARYFDVRPQARAVLLRSLRESDAQRLATELQKQVSAYIEAITGSPFSFAGLVPDQNGQYDLPAWAQPFAEMAVALRGPAPAAVGTDHTRDLVRRFETQYPPEIVGAATRLAARAEPPRPNAVAPEVWDALLRAQFVRQAADGGWEFAPGIAEEFKRSDAEMPLRGIRILWVDDKPENNRAIVPRLERMGAAVQLATSTQQGLSALRSQRPDVVISDMGRPGDRRAGQNLIGELRGAGLDVPVIVFAARAADEAALAAGAFGYTNDPEELIRLVMAAGRWPRAAETAQTEEPAGSVEALCMLPDGRLASAGVGGTIRLWDAASATETARLQSDGGSIHALCLLPEGRLAAACNDGSVRLWDLGTNKEVGRLQEHASAIHSLCLLPGGALAGGHAGGTIMQWDTTKSIGVSRIVHLSTVNALCALPDGRFASGSNDKTIAVLDPQQRATTIYLRSPDKVVALCALPDGRLASASDRTIRVWDIADGVEMARLQGHRAPIAALCVLPDGRLASAARDGTILLWAGGRQAGRFDADGPVRCLAVADGHLVAGDANGRLHWLEIAAVFPADVDTDVAALETSGARAPAKLYISSSSSTPTVERLAWNIRDDLGADGHDVFLDLGVLDRGAAWTDIVVKRIAECDVLIVLLSQSSIESEMVQEEVRLAHQRRRQDGRPLIVAIRVEYEGELGYALAAYLDRIQSITWSGPRDTDKVLAELRRSIAAHMDQFEADRRARADSTTADAAIFSPAHRKRLEHAMSLAGVDRAEELVRGSPDDARAIALAALGAVSRPEDAFRLHVRLTEAVTECVVAQVILRRGDRLEVVADYLAPGTRPGYQIADWQGVIGEAASTGQVTWVADVAASSRYIAHEPMTRSELALPLFDQRDRSSVVGVVNIEMPQPNAFSELQIAWLRRFVFPLASRIPTREPRVFLARQDGLETYRNRLDRIVRDLAAAGVEIHEVPMSEDFNVSDAILFPIVSPGDDVPAEFVGSRIVPFVIAGEWSIPLSSLQPHVVDMRRNRQAGIRQIVNTLREMGVLRPTPTDDSRPAPVTSAAGDFFSDQSSERDDPDNEHALSVSYDNVGDTQVAQGDLAVALTSYREGLAIAERVAASDPSNAKWQRDLSVWFDLVGDVQIQQGDLASATASYRDSLAIRERLAASDRGNAEWQRDLSVSFEKVGDVHVAQGDVSGALASYRGSLAIRERLTASDPGNAGWQRDLSVSFNKVGDVQVKQGDLAGALTSYRDTLAIVGRLAASDPGNAGWQRDLSVSFEKVGDVQVAQGDLAGALTSYRDSLAIRERLAASDPGNAGWQRDLIVSHVRLAKHAQAREHLSRALDIARTMQDRGTLAPPDAWMVDDLARRLADIPEA